jgi:hypothetical protein
LIPKPSDDIKRYRSGFSGKLKYHSSLSSLCNLLALDHSKTPDAEAVEGLMLPTDT